MRVRVLIGSAVSMALVACGAGGARPSGPDRLVKFKSEAEFRAFLNAHGPVDCSPNCPPPGIVPSPSVAPPPYADAAAGAATESSAAVTDASAGVSANPTITNTQTIGVDEGGIVKQIGRFLIVLQDGRLFSVDTGADGGAMALADRVNVYYDKGTAADWYDEMLVFGDRILVTAYSYRDEAFEISVFRMDADGTIRRDGRYLVSSNDYYSEENYAMRLVGDNLVIYTPYDLYSFDAAGKINWPSIRRADDTGKIIDRQPLFGARDIYRPLYGRDELVIHTVSVCPLKGALSCRSVAMMGAGMREFYVSPDSAFLWVAAPYDPAAGPIRCKGGGWAQRGGAESAALYRIPLDGAAPGALSVRGVPSDQFSLDSRDGRFRALLTQPQGGCAALDQPTPLALLDVPLTDFTAAYQRAGKGRYASVPPVAAGQLENRFLGDWLIYGGREDWDSGPPPPSREARYEARIVAVPVSRPGAATTLSVPHNVIRIERAGGNALLTGYRDSRGLSLSQLDLGGNHARLAATKVLEGRFESEGRSHAFNAKVEADGSGLIGIPTRRQSWNAGRWVWDSGTSDLSFLTLAKGSGMAEAGELSLRASKPVPGYACEVSCVDWYGNSRPIFTGGRIFALMGTELVEGQMTSGRISEKARLNLTGTPQDRKDAQPARGD
jgi:hypothetical protein